MDLPLSTIEAIEDSLKYYNKVQFSGLIVGKNGRLLGSWTNNDVNIEKEYCEDILKIIEPKEQQIIRMKYLEDDMMAMARNGFTFIFKK
ncbi:uncharacterized protein PRCAT00005338001 [Priceomyces carsonii]|uniref:uncharacterized protein n=1 Tax=Priceomyces carsonii TaxID=28549 RepID=UPI002EDA516C|nr:unnamed protein product [Priceomyces carsonii]